MNSNREANDLGLPDNENTTQHVVENSRKVSVSELKDDFIDQRRRSLDQDSTSHADSSALGDKVLTDFNNYIISFASMFRVRIHWLIFNSCYFLLEFFCLCMVSLYSSYFYLFF